MNTDTFNFNNYINSDSLFWFCALAGSGMFLIQFILNLSGLVDQDSFDAGEGGHSEHVEHTDARKVKWLSMLALTGFWMMFGWTAITCQEEFGFDKPATIGISIASGAAAAYVLGSIFKYAKRLHSPGSVFRIEDAIGQVAYVYQSIPKGGKGKISISLQNFTHEIDAVSNQSEELPSFKRVKIINKSNDNTVVVVPLE